MPFILIAEDDLVSARILCRILTDIGFEVFSVDDDDSFWVEYHKRTPDLCIIDIQLRKGNGLVILEEIRKTHRELPCLVSSASVDRTIIERALVLNAFDIVVKPYYRARIIEQVRAALAFPKGPFEAEELIIERLGIPKADLIRIYHEAADVCAIYHSQLKDILEIQDTDSRNSQLAVIASSLKGMGNNLGIRALFQFAVEIDTLGQESAPVQKFLAKLEEIRQSVMRHAEDIRSRH